MKATFRVYGADGHRQAESFNKSFSATSWNGISFEVKNADITGTNDYSVISFEADNDFDARAELDKQLSDGVFENCRFGIIEEV